MATFQNTLHVSEHSADGKLYALLSFDGKLKIWNTETNEFQREFVPNFHLNAPFTCFTWITVNGTLGPRKVCTTIRFRKISHLFVPYLIIYCRLHRRKHNKRPNMLRWVPEVAVLACIRLVKAR